MKFELNKLQGFENTKIAAFLAAAAVTRKNGEHLFAAPAPAVAAPAPAM